MALLGRLGVAIGTGSPTGEINEELALVVDRQLCAVVQAGLEVGIEDLAEPIDALGRQSHTPVV